MRYLIDSDWVIDYLEEILTARRLLVSLAPDGFGISVVTYAEVYQGMLRSLDPITAEAKLTAFVAGIPVLPLTIPIARRLAQLREALRRQGRRVRPRSLDLLIAATVIEHGLTLVTRNIDDYKDIPGLQFYEPDDL